MNSGAEGAEEAARRVAQTLEIAHRWGYGLRVDRLAELCYGGPLPMRAVDAATRSTPFVREDGFVVLSGHSDLLGKSAERRRSHTALNGRYLPIAEAFARDLVARCPFVKAVTVSGSLASEGLGEGDDIDFNLFAETDTKYIVYIQAILLGIRISFGLRKAGIGDRGSPFLRKIACVNVVWTEDQVSPFRRQDRYLAFELLRSFPVYGASYYAWVLASNPWLREHFPQIHERALTDRVGARMPMAGSRVLAALGGRRAPRRILDRVCRSIAWLLYAAVQAARFRDRNARERSAFLRRVKFPYEVFQD